MLLSTSHSMTPCACRPFTVMIERGRRDTEPAAGLFSVLLLIASFISENSRKTRSGLQRGHRRAHQFQIPRCQQREGFEICRVPDHVQQGQGGRLDAHLGNGEVVCGKYVSHSWNPFGARTGAAILRGDGIFVESKRINGPSYVSRTSPSGPLRFFRSKSSARPTHSE